MGWAYEAMIDLTGAPYQTIRFDDEDVQGKIKNGDLWRNLVLWDQEGFIMSASTPGEDVFTENGAKPEKDGIGLVAGHAYTLLGAKMTVGGVKLCQLRNPWGGFEWQGDWGDDSDLWTDEIKVSERSERASLDEDSSDEVREMATDIRLPSTTS